jgi:CRP-like cAMP-binding protein
MEDYRHSMDNFFFEKMLFEARFKKIFYQTMDNFISNFIKQYSQGFAITSETIDKLKRYLTITSHPKNHVLIRENQLHDFAYFLMKGAVRSYYLKDGTEVNTWFAFENDMVGSFHNFRNLPSRETVELLEDSTLISINLRTVKPQMYSNLQISNFIGSIIEEYAVFLEDRIFYSQFMSSMERYELLLKHEPMALQRIPLTYIASYLGISRETLSRLRGK